MMIVPILQVRVAMSFRIAHSGATIRQGTRFSCGVALFCRRFNHKTGYQIFLSAYLTKFVDKAFHADTFHSFTSWRFCFFSCSLRQESI